MREKLIDAMLNAKMRYYVRQSYTKPIRWLIADITTKEAIKSDLGYKEADALCDRMNAGLKVDAIWAVIKVEEGTK